MHHKNTNSAKKKISAQVKELVSNECCAHSHKHCSFM